MTDLHVIKMYPSDYVLAWAAFKNQLLYFLTDHIAVTNNNINIVVYNFIVNTEIIQFNKITRTIIPGNQWRSTKKWWNFRVYK